jgi:hypothetical protein
MELIKMHHWINLFLLKRKAKATTSAVAQQK